MAVLYRVGIKDDVEQIAQVHVSSWKAAYKEIVPEGCFEQMTVEHKLVSWKQIMNEARSTVIVAEECGAIVGFVLYDSSAKQSASVEIHTLYVDPASWGKGIGSRLLCLAIERLRELRYKNAWLNVLAENLNAQGFYEGHGFVNTGIRKEKNFHGYPIAVLKFELQLSICDPTS